MESTHKSLEEYLNYVDILFLRASLINFVTEIFHPPQYQHISPKETDIYILTINAQYT